MVAGCRARLILGQASRQRERGPEMHRHNKGEGWSGAGQKLQQEKLRHSPGWGMATVQEEAADCGGCYVWLVRLWRISPLEKPFNPYRE